MNDDQPLSEYKIDEKGFVVVMVTKVIVFNSYLAEFQLLKASNSIILFELKVLSLFLGTTLIFTPE